MATPRKEPANFFKKTKKKWRPPPLGQIHRAFPNYKSQINLIGIGQTRNGKGKGKGKGKGNKKNERESPALCCKAIFQDFLDVCKNSNLHNVVFCKTNNIRN